ncbi:ubiquitin carboxyl-terminal hydrolase 26 [Ochotona curzoniae]|uniref:ubiquitin carboxyl-terminal hydrolase 26 n=1 Tax=Ochotona curzoniae TaxID=130825 RepID=UPI001B34ABB4|nr:ubiquitin carboxyl-terminal hydrolase 26 [Ochotona curzoniae]
MDSMMVHGFVKVWERNIGMSQSKEAFIETVPGRKKHKLVIYFRKDETKTFQLSGNIGNVVLRTYEEDEYHLHLTFKNHNFIFIEIVSSSDAQQLKLYLDRVQTKFPPPVRAKKRKSVCVSKAIRNVTNKGSVCRGSKNSACGSSISRKIPNESTLSCKHLLGSRHGKRKRMLSDLEIDENRNDVKQSNSRRKRKSTRNHLTWAKNRKKTESEKMALVTSSIEALCLKGSEILESLTQEMLMAFRLRQKYSDFFPGWDKFEISFNFYPAKMWQGLPNLGNTCYMNAVLQSLFAIPSFTDDLVNQRFPWGRVPLNGLSMFLAQLLILKDIYNVKVKQKLLANIKKTISTLSELFSGDLQNDAHEFLGLCLEEIKDNVVKLNMMNMNKNESGEGNLSQDAFSDDTASTFLACPVTNNFESELLRSIICKTCGHFVMKTEPSNYLSINLPQSKRAFSVSIQSALNFFFAPENIDYKCEKCKHRGSVAFHKFSRLPRVLIVHLKRYSFTDYWSITKDDQEVIISRQLTLSSYCNKNTKPPLPLSKHTHIRDLQILKIFQTINSRIINSSPSKHLTAKLKKSLDLHITTDKGSKNYGGAFKTSKRRKKQKDLGKESKSNKVELELVHSEDKTSSEKALLADPVKPRKDASLSLNFTSRVKHILNPVVCLGPCIKELPENQKLQKHEKTSMSGKLGSDRITKTSGHFDEDYKNGIQEGSSTMTKRILNCDELRCCNQAFQLVHPSILEHAKTRRQTEMYTRYTNCSFQEVSTTSASELASRKNPGQAVLGGKTESKVQKAERNIAKGDHTYRLIGVISHVGMSPDSGHYISDAYDFEKQAWFCYNDLDVENIHEDLMLKSRACTGYVLFYMHNDIFEELLKREAPQPPATEAKEPSPELRGTDIPLLNKSA